MCNAGDFVVITAVLTSCGRYDLLKLTLDSFFATDGFQVEKLVVVEDGPAIPQEFRNAYVGRHIEWIDTGRRVGQVAAIDYAYSRVCTPYVFHMEDDWEFYRGGYLDASLEVLESNPKCLQVWIRAVDDMQGHPLLPHVYGQGDAAWQRLAFDYLGVWHGFSWNPGLRRLADYVSIGGFGLHARFDPAKPLSSERRIGEVFRARDFWAAALCGADGAGYVRHTGGGRHVGASGVPA
jgi:hypothetical protein